MDQDLQFFVTVGTVIAVFLWLRNDINRLDKKIDREVDALKADLSSLRTEVGSIRESLGWMRGRMGYSEPDAADKES